MTIKKIITIVAIVAALVSAFVFSSSLFETNNVRNYQVKQAFVTGSMSIKSDGGTYWQGLGDISTYGKNGMLYFSNEKLDGGDDASAQPLGCTFMGNSTAKISGVLKYQLPSGEKKRLVMHEVYGSSDAIKMELIRNQVAGALRQAGPLFRPEEAFITRRAEFTETVLSMLRNGLFATESEAKVIETSDGKTIKEMVTLLKLDSAGKPIITEESSLKKNGIIITDFVIKDIDFDQLTDNLIKKKKEAEQMQVVARANATKAKQDAITAEQQGLAAIAVARAEEEVKKITAVTAAEKLFAVAELDAKRAIQEAKKIEAKGRAEAAIAKAKVSAGLSPKEQAEFDVKRAVGVAEALSKWVGPSVVTFGGAGKSGGESQMMQALGINQMLEISKKLSKEKK